MFSSIRKRMTYTNVAMTLALVFAMAGGAFAAGGKHHKKAHKKPAVVITSTKQISKSVLAALKGNVGPVGQQGPSGPAGLAGKDGTNGANGKDGTSVTSLELAAKNVNCPTGGSEFTAAEGKKTFACNGKEGQPWTAGGTLPAKKTETGTWVSTSAVQENVLAGISFNIPLAAVLGESEVHYILPNGKESKFNVTSHAFEEVTQSACSGSASEPAAEPGNLCVYESYSQGILHSGSAPVVFIEKTGSAISNPLTSPGIGAGTSGAMLEMKQSGSEAPTIYGTWAVTAPEA